MKILVATDGSEFASEAIERLGSLILKEGNQVLLLTVYPNDLAGGVGLAPERIDYSLLEEQARKDAESVAAEARLTLEAQGFKDVQVRAAKGDSASVILATAEAETIDLIVVGSHGRTGLQRFLMGSVSSRVVNHAHCSVLVIKHSARTS